MRKIKRIPKYYIPGSIHVHLIDSKGRLYLVHRGYVTVSEATEAGQSMINSSIADPSPIIAAWLSQDITPVY